MAQVKLLKISATGVPIEFDSAADDITLNSFTVNGGPVLSSSGLDMNDSPISEVSQLDFNTPASDGINTAGGVIAADDLMAKDFENSMTTAGAILFPVVTDDADELDALRLPAIAAIPTATPADGGEGYLVWRSDIDRLYGWNGTAWQDLSVATEAESIQNTYTADEALSQCDAVYISAADNVSKAQATATGSESYCIGFAVAAAADTDPVEVASGGVLDNFSSLTAGSRYFLDSSTAGAIVSTVPSGSGNVVVQVGYAKSATELQIQILQLGRRA